MRINHQKAVLILCAAAILLIPVLRSAVLPFALALFWPGAFSGPMAKPGKAPHPPLALFSGHSADRPCAIAAAVGIRHTVSGPLCAGHRPDRHSPAAV